MEGSRFVQQGTWDSINIVEVQEESAGRATYKLTTTIMLHMGVNKSEVGDTSLAGSLTRQTEVTSAVNETKTHLANIGRLIEDTETDMRSNLNQLYILKTREIVNSLRSSALGAADGAAQAAHVAHLNAAVMGHGKNRRIDSESVSV